MNIGAISKFLEGNREISLRHNAAIKQNDKEGFNIFKLVSEIYHRENLHTDILYFLLKPEETHRQGDLYLNLFLDYLTKVHKVDINIDNYKKCEVKKEHFISNTDTNERGRMDILIRGAKNSIIIENKINNAGDTPNQLIKYIAACKGIDNIDAIIYLSMDGTKYPDQKWNVDELERTRILKKMKYISAFAREESKKDLSHGWLKRCIENTKDNEDITLVLKHYFKLLNILDKNMNTLTVPQEEFYEVITKDGEKYKLALTIADFLGKGIAIFLANKFLEAFVNQEHAPFDKPRIEAGSQVIFNGWRFGKSSSNYYLRIWFREDNQQFLVDLVDRSGPSHEDDLIRIRNVFEKYGFEKENPFSRYYSFDQKDILPQKISDLIKDLNEINSEVV